MTEFRKELNRLLKEKAIAEIVDSYNSNRMTFAEAIRAISDRKSLEEDMFWMIRNKDMKCSDDELRKKIMATSTDNLCIVWRHFN